VETVTFPSSWRKIAVTLIVMEITFGDRVRIRLTETTETLGIAGQMGIVNGRTTPSVTGIEVIGSSSKDLAIAVTLEAQTKQLWFAEEILEFVDHGPGTTVEIAGRKLIRDEHGEWREANPTDNC
jgi:hypothetical protein